MFPSRPLLAALLGAGLVAAVPVPRAVALPPVPSAATPACQAYADSKISLQDLDNSPNREGDVVVGVPTAATGAGAVDVAYDPLHHGSRARLSEDTIVGVPPAQAGDRFGAAVAYASVPDASPTGFDQCRDLAVGAPGTQGGRGSVVVLRGATGGVSRTAAAVLTGRSPGEHFGAAVATDGPHLFVGAPDRTVAGHTRAGAVDHFLLNADGPPTFVATITQDSPRIPGVAATGTRFGSVLAALLELYVGAPDETVGTAVRAGSVTAVHFDSATRRSVTEAVRLTQAGATPGTAEAGDRFGAALAAGPGDGTLLTVGVPGEGVGRLAHAGEVQVYVNHSSTRPLYVPYRTITQDTPGVPGTVEAGDYFGASVATTAWQQCGGSDRSTPIAVGAPGEDIGRVRDAGSVTIVSAGAPRTAQDAACSRAWTQGAGGLGGTLEAGDRVGSSVAPAEPWWVDDLDAEPHSAPGFVIGSPGEDIGSATDAGIVSLLLPWRPTTALTIRSTARLHSGDLFGAVRTAD